MEIYFVSLFGNNFFCIDNTLEKMPKANNIYFGFNSSVFVYKLLIKKDCVINQFIMRAIFKPTQKNNLFSQLRKDYTTSTPVSNFSPYL